MCGIYGYANLPMDKRIPFARTLACLNALRGTDASGIATLRRGEVKYCKAPVASPILAKMRDFAHIAMGELVIGHTRLATHGLPKDNRNNHPQVSGSRRVALVHNGIIRNKSELASIFNKAAQAEVDTEALLWAFAKFKAAEARDMLAKHARGSWAIAALNAATKRVYLFRNSEPLSIQGGTVAGQKWLAWSSLEEHLDTALTVVGLEPDISYKVDEGPLYVAEAGRGLVQHAISEELASAMKDARWKGYGYASGVWSLGDSGDSEELRSWGRLYRWEKEHGKEGE